MHFLHPSADISNAVHATIRGAFEYQGQKCSAASRLYCPRSLWEGGFRDALLAACSDLVLPHSRNDPLATFVGPVINEAAFVRLEHHLREAVSLPEYSLLFGGNFDRSLGYFVSPTVLLTSNPDAKLLQTELFGPILTCFVYPDAESPASSSQAQSESLLPWQAWLQKAASTGPYGLTASFFANDRLAIAQASELLRHAAGNLYINDKCTGAVVGDAAFS